MPICDRCKREADSLMESPLFKGERICDRCRTAEEETYLRVAEDLDKIIRRAEKNALYQRVLGKAVVEAIKTEFFPVIGRDDS